MNSRSDLRRALALLELPRGRVIGALAVGVAALGSALALITVSAWLIVRAWQMPAVLDLSIAVVTVRALGISRGLFRYLERVLSHDVALRGTSNARVSFYRALATGNPAAAASIRRGDLMVRAGTDLDEVGAVVVRSVLPAGAAVVLSLAAVVVVAIISPITAVVLAMAFVISGVLGPMLAARGHAHSQAESSAARAQYADAAVTVLDHHGELQYLGALDTALAQAQSAANRGTAAMRRSDNLSAWAVAASPLVAGLTVVVALVQAIALVDQYSPMTLAVLVMVPLAAFEATAVLPEAAVHWATAKQAAARVMSLVDAAAEPSTVRDAPNVVIEPGERVAVLGPSGSGKTTLLVALANEPDAVFFAEDAHIFATSIRENLLVARGDATEEQITTVLLGARAFDWVTSLPDGLDTEIDADSISGGQRRRLLLARALLSEAHTVLLDEPTEHLSADDGRALLGALLNPASGAFRADQTVVIATHHADDELLQAADQVISLSEKSVATPADRAYRRSYTRKEVV